MKKLYFGIIFILLTELSIQAIRRSRDDQGRWQDNPTYNTDQQSLIMLHNTERKLLAVILALQNNPTRSNLLEIEYIENLKVLAHAKQKVILMMSESDELKKVNTRAQSTGKIIEKIRDIKQDQQTINIRIEAIVHEKGGV